MLIQSICISKRERRFLIQRTCTEVNLCVTSSKNFTSACRSGIRTLDQESAGQPQDLNFVHLFTYILTKTRTYPPTHLMTSTLVHTLNEPPLHPMNKHVRTHSPSAHAHTHSYSHTQTYTSINTRLHLYE